MKTMFTGIVEGTQIGDSIAIDGCCQTVVTFDKNTFTANVSDETLKITKGFKAGSRVNLERALTPNTRMGGHIVQGHVDGTGKYIGNMEFEVEDSKYIVYKGSITVNGVSLTVSKLEGNIFGVAIIPHTLDKTNLKDLKIGDNVNIETDILGRYVEKFLSTQNNVSKINENFLIENGFI